MSDSSGDTPVKFEAVGGHKSSIFYGDRTRDGRSTLQKKTTAWEVLYYLAMELAKQEPYRSAHPTSTDSLRTRFVCAAGKLAAFAPRLFSLHFPPTFTPTAAALKAYAEDAEGWVVVEDGAPARALFEPLFHELFDGAEALTDFDAAYDSGVWGIGLVDETSGMQRPCVMDVKIGFIRHSPLTPEEKVQRMMAKEVNSLMRSTGLRVCGCQHYVKAEVVERQAKSTSSEAAEGGDLLCERFGKELGFAVTTVEEQSLCLKLFLSSGATLAGPMAAKEGEMVFHADAIHGMDEAAKADMDTRIAEVREDIKELLHFLEATPEGAFLLEHVAFVSASVLIIYDAAAPPATARLRFIDYARSNWRRLNYDESTIGFVQGLKNLDAYLAYSCPSAA